MSEERKNNHNGIIRNVIHKAKLAVLMVKEGGFKKLFYNIKYYKSIKEQQRKNLTESVEIDSFYQDNMSFENELTDIKLLAFHLPQYHTFPENDEWWGKDFTEWTNVKKGDARFKGHYQPRVPHEDIGYYDLSIVENIKKQADLAKQHGLYGFCYYYYWFSGKRLLEKPLDILLNHKEIDIPFCLCWANENWTRAWDGQNKDVLISQEYSDDDDNRFILDMKKYIDDERYIRVNGKPLIVVYNPGQIPDCGKSFKKWREVAKNAGIGEILIWTCQTANYTAEKLGITEYIDAEIEFPPHNYWQDSLAVRNVDLNGKNAYLYSYKRLVEYVVEKIKVDDNRKVPLHYCSMMAWDNAARRKNDWFTYTGFSLRSFYKWLVTIFEKTRREFPEEERFVFINAWNEWGEGTYLEPDEKYGYANINTVSKALFKRTLDDDLIIINDKNSQCTDIEFERDDETPRIAVQIHMFYTDVLDETIQYLNCIPYKFDCYVSTDTSDKQELIEKKFRDNCKCEHAIVEIFENVGRDVAPLLQQMKDRIYQYDYLCHIHSKKTKTDEHGDDWRKYIFRHLFGNERYLKKVFEVFEENRNIGILMPETYPVLELQAEWGGNKEGTQTLLEWMNMEVDLPETPVFPVGNMFWMRTNAVKDIFELGLTAKDFPAEGGQINLTIAHQIERAWIYIATYNGFTYKKIFNNISDSVELEQKNRILMYMHFDKAHEIKKCDIDTLKCFKSICEKVYFLSNSSLNERELAKVDGLADEIILRENHGFDFGAWREGITSNREVIKKAEELILLNNSCITPIFDIKEVFSDMEKRDIDFWGNTIFPFLPDGSYLGTDYIDEHIQSYFMVLNNNVLNSKAFWEFWDNMPICESFTEVVAKCESKFTKRLADEGFKYEPYINESKYICRFLNNYAIPYEKPSSLVLLGNPFVKKKCYDYMDEVEHIKLENIMALL